VENGYRLFSCERESCKTAKRENAREKENFTFLKNI
jgi:hypothetical protein